MRTALTGCRRHYGEVRDSEMQRLEASDSWKKLSPEQRKQLLAASPVPDADSSSLSSEEELLAALRATPIQQWSDRTDAIAGRIDKLLTDAARLLEPKVQQVRMSSPTLRTEAEVKAWIAAQEQTLLAKLKDGPVVVS